jgi:hypothetical protein
VFIEFIVRHPQIVVRIRLPAAPAHRIWVGKIDGDVVWLPAT